MSMWLSRGCGSSKEQERSTFNSSQLCGSAQNRRGPATSSGYRGVRFYQRRLEPRFKLGFESGFQPRLQLSGSDLPRSLPHEAHVKNIIGKLDNRMLGLHDMRWLASENRAAHQPDQ